MGAGTSDWQVLLGIVPGSLQKGWPAAPWATAGSLHSGTRSSHQHVRSGFFPRGMKAERKASSKKFKEECILHAKHCCTVFPYGVYPKKGCFSDSGSKRRQCSLQQNQSFCHLLITDGGLGPDPVLGAAWRDPCFWVASLPEALRSPA